MSTGFAPPQGGGGGGDIDLAALTEKDTPVSADLLLLGDSAASFANKKTTVADIRSSGYIDNWLHYQDQESSGTSGGTFTAGDWRTRVLNTEVTDTGGLGSLASNQITLAAGDYVVWASAPAYNVDYHAIRLWNVTSTAVLLHGSSEYCDSTTTQTRSFLHGIISLDSPMVIELQHQCSATAATAGLGVGSTFTSTEVFSDILLGHIEGS